MLRKHRTPHPNASDRPVQAQATSSLCRFIHCVAATNRSEASQKRRSCASAFCLSYGDKQRFDSSQASFFCAREFYAKTMNRQATFSTIVHIPANYSNSFENERHDNRSGGLILNAPSRLPARLDPASCCRQDQRALPLVEEEEPPLLCARTKNKQSMAKHRSTGPAAIAAGMSFPASLISSVASPFPLAL